MADTADTPERQTSVVIDEDLDVRLRLHFGDKVRAETVAFRGWKGLKNGALLQAMIAAGDVDVFVTADQNLRHQQRVAALPFGILVLRSPSKRLVRLLELMPEVRRVLPTVVPGVAREVSHAAEVGPPAADAPPPSPPRWSRVGDVAEPTPRLPDPPQEGKGRKR